MRGICASDKKALALVLAMLLAFGTLVVSVSADETLYDAIYIVSNGNAFAKAMAKSGTAAQQNLGATLYNYGVACFADSGGKTIKRHTKSLH